MTVRLCTENSCSEEHCTKPARHGALCVPHYLAASPAVRAVCDLLDRIDARCAREDRQLATLEAIWTAPAAPAVPAATDFVPLAEAA